LCKGLERQVLPGGQNSDPEGEAALNEEGTSANQGIGKASGGATDAGAYREDGAEK